MNKQIEKLEIDFANQITLKKSETKEILLHSDAIHAIENIEIYKDGLGNKQNKDEIILNLISLNQYLLKELSKIKIYLKNL